MADIQDWIDLRLPAAKDGRGIEPRITGVSAAMAGRFRVSRIVGSDAEAVSAVIVTDGVQTARAISLFTVSDGRIASIVEFWPEPYAPASNRAHLVEPME